MLDGNSQGIIVIGQFWITQPVYGNHLVIQNIVKNNSISGYLPSTALSVVVLPGQPQSLLKKLQQGKWNGQGLSMGCFLAEDARWNS